MPLGIECPSCQHRFQIPDKMAGRGVKCPKCERPFTAVNGSPDAPPAENPPPAIPVALAAPAPSHNGGDALVATQAAAAPPRRPAGRKLTTLVLELPASVLRKMPGQPQGVAGLAVIALLVGLF